MWYNRKATFIGFDVYIILFDIIANYYVSKINFVTKS